MARNNADDSRLSARDLGVLNKRKSIRDSLRSNGLNSDYDDFYKFQLTGSSSVSIALTGLKGNADLRLSGGGDSSGSIAVSRKRGKKSEKIVRNLEKGTYYIQVSQDGVSTKYTLTVTPGAEDGGNGGGGGGDGGSGGGSGGGDISSIDFNSPTPITPASDPGNLPATAFNVGKLSGIKSYRDIVGGADTADFYKFTVDSSSKVRIATGNLSGGNVETSLVYDINGNDFVDQGDVIAQGNVITKSLGAGTYFVGVKPLAEKVTYTVRLEETAITGLTTATNPPIGLGGATDLGAVVGSRTVQRIVSSSDTTTPQLVGTFDSTDIYKFTLNDVSNFSALLNSNQPTGDVTMSVIYDEDGNGIANPGELIDGLVVGGDFIGGVFTGGSVGGAALTIDKTLGAGTYYLAVTQRKVTDNTTYSLDLFVNNTVSGISPINEPNNGVKTAFNLGVLTQNVSYKQFVGSVDDSDFYTFTLDQPRNIIIRYNGTPELVALRFGSDLNNDGFLGLGEDLNGDGKLNQGEDLNGNGKLDREVFAQQLSGDVVYSPLPPFHNSEAKFDLDPRVNGFLTKGIATDIYARLPAGTYTIQVDPQKAQTDLGDSLIRYGSANVLYNLSFMVEPS